MNPYEEELLEKEVDTILRQSRIQGIRVLLGLFVGIALYLLAVGTLLIHINNFVAALFQ